jgi:hypothetical protein
VAENGDEGSSGWDELLDAYARLTTARVNFRPASDEQHFEGGFVVVVASAEDDEDFDRQARDLVEEAGYTFVDAERVRRLTDTVEDNASMELFPLATEAVQTGRAAAGDFIVFEETQTAAELAEETRLWREVQDARRLVELVTLDSDRDGILLDFSDALVLFQYVDTTAVLVDGYGLFLRQEVLRFEEVSESFVPVALELKGQSVRRVDAPLNSLADFFTWAQGACPLVSIIERVQGSDGSYVGVVTGVGPDQVTLRGVNRVGESVGEWVHDLADILRVDFFTNYLAALALVLEKRL